MRLENRVPTEHTALVILECLVGVLAVLGTVGVLLVDAVTIHAVAVGLRYVGAPPVVGALLSRFVALLALLALLASARLVVLEYRRFLERAPETRRPIALTAGPLVGLVTPVVYAGNVPGTTELPWPVLGLAAVAAHALAFRTIALWSRDSELARPGELVGTLAGIPLVFALVTFLTERILFGPLDDAGRLLLATPGWGLVPRDALSLVVVPVIASAAFGLYRLLWKRGRVEIPDPDLPDVPGPIPAVLSAPLGRWIPAITLTDVALAWANRVHQHTTQRWGRADDAAPRDPPPVPTPPGASGSRTGSVASARASPRSPSISSRESDSPGPRPPSSPSSSSSSSGRGNPGSFGKQRVKSAAVDPDAESGDDTDSGADGSTTQSNDGNASAADTPGSSTPDESGDSADAVSTDSGQAESTSPPDGPDGDSHTQIFTPEADETREAPGGSVVETCPECEADVPSDGTYEFCPLCGHEL